MTVDDVRKILERWAPPRIAWERDNVGLQVGDSGADVQGVLVCLDVTEDVVAEAGKRQCNVIISHHPLLFRPVKTISPATETGRVIVALVKSDVHLLSAHTNLDFARRGVSFALAERLGLQAVEFLHRDMRLSRKIVTFVPEDKVDAVAGAMARAGAGHIGHYEECSFRTNGTGTFRGDDATNPAVGTKNVLEKVSEVRLEMMADEWNVPGVISAMKSAHPYEEVAYDIYPTENVLSEYGMGCIGSVPKRTPLNQFLAQVKEQLGAGSIRYSETPDVTIERVAVCGGSGAELISAAVGAGAQAFVTADVRYHDFHEAKGKIVIIDAGHFETESPVVERVVHYLRTEFARSGSDIRVCATAIATNPVRYL